MSVLLEAAKTHLGITLLSNYVALPEIRSGSLVMPLPDFPVPDLWIKAMVPIDRLKMPRVNALLRFIRSKGGGSDSLTRDPSGRPHSQQKSEFRRTTDLPCHANNTVQIGARSGKIGSSTLRSAAPRSIQF